MCSPQGKSPSFRMEMKLWRVCEKRDRLRVISGRKMEKSAMKRIRPCVMFAFLFSLLAAWPADAGIREANPLCIAGLVPQPLTLTLQDLGRMQPAEAQIMEISSGGASDGVLRYRGVPLRFLLEAAHIAKEESVFGGQGDLAVMVRNSSGEAVLLSWGEILYGSPGDFLIAYAAEPVMPLKEPGPCTDPALSSRGPEPLAGGPAFPKLVVSCDRRSDRFVEGVCLIRVVDVCPDPPRAKVDPLHSESFELIAGKGSGRRFEDLSPYPRRTLSVDQVGSDGVFQGTVAMEGVSLKDLLSASGMEPDLRSGFVVSAPDGYQALFSAGEIFLGRMGGRILLADRRDGRPIEEGGRFFLVAPDDRLGERWVKAVARIERVGLPDGGRLFVIGTGSGDSHLLTHQAVAAFAEADVYVCPPDLHKEYAGYMGDKPVLFDIYSYVPPVVRKAHPELSKADQKALLVEKQRGAAELIRQALDAGRNVGIVEYGDPTIWSGWSWVRDYVDPGELKIIPGLSSFNTSNALIRTDVACNGGILVAAPWMLLQNPSVVESAGAAGVTICIFMGLSSLDDLTPVLLRGYQAGTPARLVYKAGYAEEEQVVPTTLEKLAETARRQKEQYLGLIYVGPCLKGDERSECPL